MVMASNDNAWQQIQQICLGLQSNNSVTEVPPFQSGNVCSWLNRCSGRQWQRKSLSVCEHVTQNKAMSAGAAFQFQNKNLYSQCRRPLLATANYPVVPQQVLKQHYLHWLLRQNWQKPKVVALFLVWPHWLTVIIVHCRHCTLTYQ